MLATPSPVVMAVGLLTFGAAIVGFAAPALHRSDEHSELAKRQWKRHERYSSRS